MGPKPISAPVRFWRRVTPKDSGCWIWVGGHDRQGYGFFNPVRTTTVMAHRYSYEYFVGPIPDGLEIDHLCRAPSCVQPAHLEPVTRAENRRRARPTHCWQGHEFTPENTIRCKLGRSCRTCKNARQREYWHRDKLRETAP